MNIGREKDRFRVEPIDDPFEEAPVEPVEVPVPAEPERELEPAER